MFLGREEKIWAVAGSVAHSPLHACGTWGVHFLPALPPVSVVPD